MVYTHVTCSQVLQRTRADGSALIRVEQVVDGVVAFENEADAQRYRELLVADGADEVCVWGVGTAHASHAVLQMQCLQQTPTLCTHAVCVLSMSTTSFRHPLCRLH